MAYLLIKAFETETNDYKAKRLTSINLKYFYISKIFSLFAKLNLVLTKTY